MQPIVPLLTPWEIVSGEFNSMLLDLSTPDSRAASPDFTHILCLYDSDAMQSDGIYGSGSVQQCHSFLSALEAFCKVHPQKVIVASTFCFGSRRWLNFADLLHPRSLHSVEKLLNERLIVLARANPNLLLIDIETLYRRHGEDALLSNSFWYLGRIRYTNRMFRSLATMVRQAVRAYSNRARKVLVLDLDNTLWGGIVGETGPLGIALSEEGEGRCFRDFQRAVKAAQQTGVLLAICSKNNLSDLDEVFDRNNMMILRREDFACIRANWRPKPENIAEIAEVLNLDVDSFVFIDDNPVERELVRETIAGIAVPEFPGRVEDLPAWFEGEVAPEWFGKYTITSEDLNKAGQYRANEERRQLSSTFDLEGFLAALEIECTIHVDPADRVARIAQMTQKTNQFNLTTRRYGVPEIRHFLESQDHSVILIEYKDRFGSEGAVGLAILNFPQLRVDTLLMSCRVIGRKVEDRILAEATRLFQTRGLTRMVSEFLPTLKNQQVANFYDMHGFTLVSQDQDGRKVYEKIIG
jgi:FkbH-like protein